MKDYKELINDLRELTEAPTGRIVTWREMPEPYTGD